MSNTNCDGNDDPPPPPDPPKSHFDIPKIVKSSTSFFLSWIRSFAYYGSKVLEFFVFVYNFISTRMHPFWIELSYYLILTLVGSLVMMRIKPRVPTYQPRYIDMLYMSTAAVTLSGLNSVDTEIFSESQILILTLLMLVGGEVFVSLLTLVFQRTENPIIDTNSSAISLPVLRIRSSNRIESIEIVNVASSNQSIISVAELEKGITVRTDLKQRAVRLLEYVVVAYLVGFHIAGFVSVLTYFYVISSAKYVLDSKGIKISIAAAMTVVSSFANGGILPTNENMGRFKSNSGLLLILIPLIFAGNTLFPACLRIIIWCLRKVTGKPEFDLMMKNPSELAYAHIFPTVTTLSISMTTVAIVVVQIVLYCTLNWNSDVFSGLNSYQKVVGVSFQSVNTRHAGEGAFDLSITAPAVLVLFISVMYLTSYTSFMPLEDGEDMRKKGNINKRSKLKKALNLSMITYVILFLITACILEREKLAKDPLNFTVISMLFETMSAYGNVGLSMGYSCGRLLPPDSTCKDGGYSFSGRWSDGGKLLIVFVMLFGKMKRYHMGGGKAWKLK